MFLLRSSNGITKKLFMEVLMVNKLFLYVFIEVLMELNKDYLWKL